MISQIKKLLQGRYGVSFWQAFKGHIFEDFTATLSLLSIEWGSDGSLMVSADDDSYEAAFHNITKFDLETIAQIAKQTELVIRKDKFDELREFVHENGGDMFCDASFGYHSVIASESDAPYVSGEKSMIKRVKQDASGALYFCCECGGELTSDGEGSIPTDELDAVVDYIKSQGKKEYTFTIYGSFSYMVTAEAKNEEEAHEIALGIFAKENFYDYVQDFNCERS